MPFKVDISQAACGETHTILLSSNGYIFSFGKNKHG